MDRGSKLKGRVVAISGGARGIGLATARAFAGAGAMVAIGDVDADLATEQAAAFGGMGAHLDVRDRVGFRRFLTEVQGAIGPVDILVNNAGIMPAGPFHEASPELMDTQIDINLRGVIHGMQAALPGMLQRDAGHIINVASLAGRFALPGLAVYCATKYAVVGLTESAAAEYRDTGIAFSTIMPAKVRTDLAAGTDDADAGIPTVDPEDVAAAILRTALKPELFVAVPRFMENASAIYRLLPGALTTFGRRLIRDNRILHQVNARKRAHYDRRLAALAGDPDAGL